MSDIEQPEQTNPTQEPSGLSNTEKVLSFLKQNASMELNSVDVGKEIELLPKQVGSVINNLQPKYIIEFPRRGVFIYRRPRTDEEIAAYKLTLKVPSKSKTAKKRTTKPVSESPSISKQRIDVIRSTKSGTLMEIDGELYLAKKLVTQ